MKKVILLVLTVMLVSAFLMASGPSLKIVKLTVFNKSGNEVMIKLEGSEIGKQFYYLTIPAGTPDWPTVKVFTVLEDVYKRTTWYGEGAVSQCVGVKSTGWLVMDRNNRLVFTPCYTMPANAGEPSMEKVAYVSYAHIVYGERGDLTWDDWDDSEMIARAGCGYMWLGWDVDTSKSPDLCRWRYSYGDLKD
jgi:hypothetical protein